MKRQVLVACLSILAGNGLTKAKKESSSFFRPWQQRSAPPKSTSTTEPTENQPVNDYNQFECPDSYPPFQEYQEPPPQQQQEYSDFQDRQQQYQSQYPPQNPYYDHDSNRPNTFSTSRQQQQQQQQRRPIHYEFPSSQWSEENGPSSATPNQDTMHYHSSSNKRQLTETASPRQDYMTRYMRDASIQTRLLVHILSTTLGMSLGIALAKSLIPRLAKPMAWIGGFLFFLFSSVFRRSSTGEWVRALAVSFLLSFQQIHQIRRTYPVRRYIFTYLFRRNRGRALLRPFPMGNPWQESSTFSSTVASSPPTKQPPFHMLYCLVAMAMVGSICGANLPVIPTWLGSILGASLLVYGCTLDGGAAQGRPHTDLRGDICRLMGMRVVAWVQAWIQIQQQLDILPKTMVVFSQLLDRLLILDRQHHLRDRLMGWLQSLYEFAMQLWRSSRGEGGNYPPASSAGTQRQPSPPPKQAPPQPRRPPSNSRSNPTNANRYQEDERHQKQQRRPPPPRHYEQQQQQEYYQEPYGSNDDTYYQYPN